jgi:F-type H+-transporting ATPase subunit epsilon
MADKLHFDLVSPERLLLSEDVDMVTVPGKEGELGVLAGHAPVMTTLRPGIIAVEEAGKPQRRIFVRGGFAEVTPAGLTVLAEKAIPFDEFDGSALDAEVGEAEAALAAARSEEARLAAQERMDYLKQLRTLV